MLYMANKYNNVLLKVKERKCFRCGKKTNGYLCRECFCSKGTHVTTSRNRLRKKGILEIIKKVEDEIF